MQSAQLVAPQRVELRTMEDPPTPGPDEVLVRLREVGLCGSDMHWYAEGSIAGISADYPMVLGHEPAGEIEDVGPGVERLRPGARVAVEPAISCGVCVNCSVGHFNLCTESLFMGGFPIPGLLREYAVVPARNVDVVPDAMSLTEAVIVEPLAVLLHTFELAELRMGETVAVMGAGPIGLLAVAVAKLKGASSITVADRIPERLELAKRFGADVVVNLKKDSVSDAVRDATGGRGAHVVVDAAANAESVRNSIASARERARVIVVGIASQREVGVPFWDVMDKELNVCAQKRSNNNNHEAIEIIERGLVNVNPLVTHRFSLGQSDKAFLLLHNYSDGVSKIVIEL